jgi:dUTP pyrophosphatase
MAGKLGAKTLQNTDFSVALPLFKYTSFYSFLPLKPRFWQILPYPSRRHRALNLALTMAHSDLESNSLIEIKEPLLKIPKLGQNGVSAAAISENSTSLLRVKKLSEKAVLPSRASPLSAGYDLSRLK